MRKISALKLCMVAGLAFVVSTAQGKSLKQLLATREKVSENVEQTSFGCLNGAISQDQIKSIESKALA
jgi:hypothetical protein